MTEMILNLHKEKQPEVNVTIEQKPVAVRFECEHCGKEVDFNGDIELD